MDSEKNFKVHVQDFNNSQTCPLLVSSLFFSKLLVRICDSIVDIFQIMVNYSGFDDFPHVQKLKDSLRNRDMPFYRDFFDPIYDLPSAMVRLDERFVYCKTEYVPFKKFSNNDIPPWWKSYEEIKNSKRSEKKKTSRENVISALAGLFLLNVLHIESQEYLLNFKYPRPIFQYLNQAGPRFEPTPSLNKILLQSLVGIPWRWGKHIFCVKTDLFSHEFRVDTYEPRAVRLRMSSQKTSETAFVPQKELFQVTLDDLREKVNDVLFDFDSQTRWIEHQKKCYLQKVASLITKATEAYSRKELDVACVFACGLAEDYKIAKMVWDSKLALDQVRLKLDIISDMKDLVDKLRMVIGVFSEVTARVWWLDPKNKPKLERIVKNCLDILSIIEGFSNESAGNLDIVTIDKEVEKIFGETKEIADQKMKTEYSTLLEQFNISKTENNT